MNCLAFTHHAAQHRPSPRRDRMIAEVLLELSRKHIACDAWIGFALRPVNRCAVRITQARSRLDQRIQHRLKVESRAADDFEDIGSGCLLLQRFGEVVSALAQLVEQPGVLDRDDGLSGENLYQFNLLVQEWAYPLAIQNNATRKRT